MSSHRKNQKITYAFVDAANIIYRQKDKGYWKIDLKKLISYLKSRFHAKHVLYFGGVDSSNAVQNRLYTKMESWGYEMRLNPVKKFTNDRGERYNKADVDSRMTFEMMRLEKEYDQAVVLTGDGDYYWVLQYLIEKKDRIWLIASPDKTAKELKQLFGPHFTSFDDTRKWLEYTKK